MAQNLKQQALTNFDGTELWITDMTLGYNAGTNPGGWGSPNPELNQTALVAYVVRRTSDGDFPLVPLTSAISFNDSDPNTAQRSIGFNYKGDGHYISTLFSLPASSDGVTSLAGHTFVSGDYFYYNGAIWTKPVSGPNVEVTDYSTMLTIDAIVKVTNDFAFFNQLSIKNQTEYYRKYRDARKANDEEILVEMRQKMDVLNADLTGAIWLFGAGLLVQFENAVAELLEEHEIKPI